jgi:hypothetical protein
MTAMVAMAPEGGSAATPKVDATTPEGVGPVLVALGSDGVEAITPQGMEETHPTTTRTEAKTASQGSKVGDRAGMGQGEAAANGTLSGLAMSSAARTGAGTAAQGPAAAV